MRALGLDVGSKTIGVAMTDEAEIAAHPLTVLARTGTVGDTAAVGALIDEHGITDVVIGMPFELSGKVGHRGKRVLVFANALREAFGDRVQCHEVDERFTTAEAERILLQADLSREKRKAVIDQQAAALILKAWLDTYKRK
jgi:putative pre-16S rRNA nuclease